MNSEGVAESLAGDARQPFALRYFISKSKSLFEQGLSAYREDPAFVLLFKHLNIWVARCLPN
jgi:hypothetical protein